ncbi:hypothetical protein PGTUg99_018824 [Puccinia graminis f. sp. tritici]|uniref:Uncharacterized protein n=1 Tax=Puccinia graminis f. sp. tritici TaxID=56615 RepID=A0A5B0SL04_PUCGR|nr:hypothetical protein PGTUg99_018824 [Puccinia graminis f. sp. tritici]
MEVFRDSFGSIPKSRFGGDFDTREFQNFSESISKKHRKLFERPSESISNRIAKCTWTKVQDVRPCGGIFRNISERTSEMFRNPAPVV